VKEAADSRGNGAVPRPARLGEGTQGQGGEPGLGTLPTPYDAAVPTFGTWGSQVQILPLRPLSDNPRPARPQKPFAVTSVRR
jgi:hypothetical protein